MNERVASGIYEVALVLLLAVPGVSLLRSPVAFLEKFGRPTTEKHIRATRLIGAIGVGAALITLVQWLRTL